MEVNQFHYRTVLEVWQELHISSPSVVVVAVEIIKVAVAEQVELLLQLLQYHFHQFLYLLLLEAVVAERDLRMV
jgi:hypothetical protein